MEGFFAVDSEKIEQYAMNLEEERHIAIKLNEMLRNARRIAYSADPDQVYRYTKLIHKIEVLIDCLGKLKEAAELISDDVQVISMITRAQIEENIAIVEHNMHLY